MNSTKKDQTSIIHCNTFVGYPVHKNMQSALQRANENVKIIEEIAKIESNKKIAIVFTGSSGSILAALTYERLMCKEGYNIFLINVRKPGDDCHQKGEGEYTFYKDFVFIFIDDLIESGKTMKRVFKEMSFKYAICRCNDFAKPFNVVKERNLKKYQMTTITI